MNRGAASLAKANTIWRNIVPVSAAMQRERGWFRGRVRKTLAGLGLLLVVSLVCQQTQPLPDTAAFLLLLCVLVIASLGDMPVAILLSLAADLSYLWFLPPDNSFAIEGVSSWIALAAFLATAVIGSQLSIRAQRRAREAEDRNQEMERIHALGRALLAHDTLSATGEAATWQIVAALEASGAALYSAQLQRIHRAGAIPELDLQLREVFRTGEPWTGASPRISIYPLTSGNYRIGALAIQSDLSDTAAQLTISLISVAMERAAATEKAVEASAISRNQELRRAMVDAFAHNLKTPLTSIKACASALLRRAGSANGGVNEETRELLTVVDEETDRLIRLIGDSLELVRVGERVTPARELIPVTQPILAALADLQRNVEGRKITTDLPQMDLPVAADPHLIQIVMTQLLDNALKYSPPDSPIEVKVWTSAGYATIAVRNEGAAIDDDERERIFDKFYRGRKSRGRIEGTGMGLAIARTIVESHGGEIEARNDPQGRIVFQFSLPLAPDTVMEGVTL
jgi:two-component system sensor histidine kinase KdpD